MVYSFQRVLAIGKAPSGAFKPVLKPDNVTAPDKQTVRFVLDKPTRPFLVGDADRDDRQPARGQGATRSNGDWGAAWLASNGAGSGAYQLDAGDLPPARARRS